MGRTGRAAVVVLRDRRRARQPAQGGAERLPAQCGACAPACAGLFLVAGFASHCSIACGGAHRCSSLVACQNSPAAAS